MSPNHNLLIITLDELDNLEVQRVAVVDDVIAVPPDLDPDWPDCHRYFCQARVV